MLSTTSLCYGATLETSRLKVDSANFSTYLTTRNQPSPRSKTRLGDRTYARDDGTLAHYFTAQDLIDLAEQAGLELVEPPKVCTVRLQNRRKGVGMHRCYIHAKLRRPFEAGLGSKRMTTEAHRETQNKTENYHFDSSAGRRMLPWAVLLSLSASAAALLVAHGPLRGQKNSFFYFAVRYLSKVQT